MAKKQKCLVCQDENEIINYFLGNESILPNTKNAFLATTKLRENILNWYPFDKNATVLELGANFGEITGTLCNRAKKVVAVTEFDKFKSCIKARHKDKKNLEVICSSISELNLNQQFDYIVIINFFSVIPKTYRVKKSYKLFFAEIKRHLNKNGKIIFAINNEIGIRNFAFSNYKGDRVESLNLDELDLIIEESEFNYSRKYYPFNDYKISNIIFSEDQYPNSENIHKNLDYNAEDELMFYDQNKKLLDIIKTNRSLFPLFANSLLVELSNEPINNDIKCVSFGCLKKEKYQMKTVITANAVYKIPVSDKSKEHLNRIKTNIRLLKKMKLKTPDNFDKNMIISKYISADTYDMYLMKKLNEKGIKYLKEEIEKYCLTLIKAFKKGTKNNNIFNQFDINYEQSEIEELTFLKNGLWDAIFQNIFYYEDDYYFYDQEWYNQNVPLEFILFRNILYFNDIKKYYSNTELFEMFGLTKYIRLFSELETKLQNEINDSLAKEIFGSNKKAELIVEEHDTLVKVVNAQDFELKRMNDLVRNVKEKIEKSSEIEKTVILREILQMVSE